DYPFYGGYLGWGAFNARDEGVRKERANWPLAPASVTSLPVRRHGRAVKARHSAQDHGRYGGTSARAPLPAGPSRRLRAPRPGRHDDGRSTCLAPPAELRARPGITIRSGSLSRPDASASPSEDIYRINRSVARPFAAGHPATRPTWGSRLHYEK